MRCDEVILCSQISASRGFDKKGTRQKRRLRAGAFQTRLRIFFADDDIPSFFRAVVA